MKRIFVLVCVMFCFVNAGAKEIDIEQKKMLEKINFNITQMLFTRSVAREASSHIGKPYVWGGDEKKDGGFDCSGYPQFVFNKLGVKIPRTAVMQFAQGLVIEKGAVAIGDLVFFVSTRSGSSLHVGIYVGDGGFLHAPRKGKKIKRDRLDKGYWKKRFHAVRRFLPEKKQKTKK